MFPIALVRRPTSSRRGPPEDLYRLCETNPDIPFGMGSRVRDRRGFVMFCATAEQGSRTPHIGNVEDQPADPNPQTFTVIAVGFVPARR
jgi:hypothetical protein